MMDSSGSQSYSLLMESASNPRRLLRLLVQARSILLVVLLSLLAWQSPGAAADGKITYVDNFIDSADPGVRLFVRTKWLESKTRADDSNVVIFIHGRTLPSLADFDLQYKDYSWADWMAKRGYIVYLFDVRNFGRSTREPAMTEPPSASRPLSRSHLALRDLHAVVEHARAEQGVEKISLIGWSWGATLAGYYASLYEEMVASLVLYAPLYAVAGHPDAGASSWLRDPEDPELFNRAIGGYRLVPVDKIRRFWDAQIPTEDKSLYREEEVLEAFLDAILESDKTSALRDPPSIRAPNGPLEDAFYQGQGRRLFHASTIRSPTLIVAGEFDRFTLPKDRFNLVGDLTRAPVTQVEIIPEATHILLLEKRRFELYETVHNFLQDAHRRQATQ